MQEFSVWLGPPQVLEEKTLSFIKYEFMKKLRLYKLDISIYVVDGHLSKQMGRAQQHRSMLNGLFDFK